MCACLPLLLRAFEYAFVFLIPNEIDKGLVNIYDAMGPVSSDGLQQNFPGTGVQRHREIQSRPLRESEANVNTFADFLQFSTG